MSKMVSQNQHNEVVSYVHQLEEVWEKTDNIRSLWRVIGEQLSQIGCQDVFFISPIAPYLRGLTSLTIYQLPKNVTWPANILHLNESEAGKLITRVEGLFSKPFSKITSICFDPFEEVQSGSMSINTNDREISIYASRHNHSIWSTGYTLFTADKKSFPDVVFFGNILCSFLDIVHLKLIELETDESMQTINLSPREMEVLRLLIKGKTNRDIADTLAISIYTVNGYVRHLSLKFGVTSRTVLALKAVSLGLV